MKPIKPTSKPCRRGRLAAVVCGLWLALAVTLGLGAGAGPLEIGAAWASPAAGDHGGGHGSGGHGSGHGPKPINWFRPADKSKGRPPPFAANLFNFAALLVVLAVLLRKPLADMVSGRYTQITRDLEEASQRRAEAEAKLKEYESRLAGLDEERKRILADIRAEGEAEKARLIADAREQASRLKSEAEFLISQEMKQLRIDLERQLVDLTMLAAETGLRTSFDDQQQQRLIDNFISELGASASAPAPAATSTRSVAS